MTCILQLLQPDARLRGFGNALPAELLPYAAAQLLPALLLPPERVRALDLAHLAPSLAAIEVSHFLSGTVVRTPLPAARHPEERRSSLAEGGGSERAPGSAGVQGVAGQLVACPQDCKALVLACPGLVPFVVEALRALAERRARLPECSQWARSCWVRTI